MTLPEAVALLESRAERADQLAAVERGDGRLSAGMARHHADNAEAIRIVLAALTKGEAK